MDAGEAQHIAELMPRYGAAIDERDWSALPSAFTSDAEFDYAVYGGRFRGLAALKSYLCDAVAQLTATQHVFANLVYELEGDQGELRCSVLAHHMRRDAGADQSLLVVGGSYVNALARTGDGWRISHFRFTPIWTSGDATIVKTVG
jgi:3-phenylpropionate/cinnamic acid dioxygenase small subunit